MTGKCHRKEVKISSTVKPPHAYSIYYRRGAGLKQMECIRTHSTHFIGLNTANRTRDKYRRRAAANRSQRRLEVACPSRTYQYHYLQES